VIQKNTSMTYSKSWDTSWSTIKTDTQQWESNAKLSIQSNCCKIKTMIKSTKKWMGQSTESDQN